MKYYKVLVIEVGIGKFNYLSYDDVRTLQERFLRGSLSSCDRENLDGILSQLAKDFTEEKKESR